MHVWVVLKVLPPGVQHAQEADLCAQMLWLGGDLMQRLRRRLEQNVIDHGLVLERDGGDLVRDREHHVEVGYVEQLCLTVLEPLSPGETLALRAVPITARVVRDTLMAAVAATLDVTAERSGATAFDRDHGVPPRRGQRRAMPVTENRAEVTEHIRHFQPFAGHGTRTSGGHEVRRGRRDGVECFQRAGGGTDLGGGDHEILRRGAQIAMTEQQLDGTQIGAGLQQVNGEGMA